MNDGFIPKPGCAVGSGDCFYQSRCLGRCTKSEPQVGWKCPVCGKGNAPFQKLCANTACGIDFTVSAVGASK